MSRSPIAADSLPVVVVPVGVDDVALDASLSALDAATPAGTRVWLIDDAQAGPRGVAIVQRWLDSTPLQADYTRRQRAIGEVEHLDEALAACGDANVVVLACNAQVTDGWLGQLQACLDRDASIATATPWSNAGETAGWPHIGGVATLPDNAAAIAMAAATMPPRHPELPAAVDHAVALRGSARHKSGGLDVTGYRSWYAALVDLSMRLSGMGWRNVLCDTVFVQRSGEGAPADGDLEALAIRWPVWHARLAKFLMDDPLHDLRAELGERLADSRHDRQHDLFGSVSTPGGLAPTCTTAAKPGRDSLAQALMEDGCHAGD